MSMASRKLEVGDLVTTDFSGRITSHQIIKKLSPACSQSGVLFWVSPRVPKSGDGGIDADWFEGVGP